ncbi:MAG: hypothetical protein ABIG35_01325 [Pseudomonadota bacterium]
MNAIATVNRKISRKIKWPDRWPHEQNPPAIEATDAYVIKNPQKNKYTKITNIEIPFS